MHPVSYLLANASVLVALALTGCTSPATTPAAPAPSAETLDREALAMIRGSFRDEGIAKTDRLEQDDANAACSAAQGQPLSDAQAEAVQQAALVSVKHPSDGNYLGDWQQGEAIAQSGRGMTFTDSAKVVNGGNCYNCHQITKQEISFGTIGPSLYQYGKNRGITDPKATTAKSIIEYTWVKLWNARAYGACSQMPRFGHLGLLSEEQLRHVMALLVDPRSPVNQ